MTQSTVEAPQVEPVPNTQPSEPATTTGSMVSLGTVLVNSLVMLGVPLPDQTKVYIVVGVAVLGPIIAGVLIRAKVFSPATVQDIVDRLESQLAGAQSQAVQLRSRLDTQQIAHATALDAVKATIIDSGSQRVVPLPDAPVRAAQMPNSLFGAPQYPEDPQSRQGDPRTAQRPTWPSQATGDRRHALPDDHPEQRR